MKIHNIQDLIIPSNCSPIIFISGVTGQDGSLMTDYLLKTQPNAFIVGGARRLSVNNHDNIKHLEHEPRFAAVHFDLTDSHSVHKVVNKVKPNYFINFAAQSFVASSWDFSLSTLQTNVAGVVNCLEAIRDVCPNCRFYNAGSSEEFGNVIYEPQDENHPLRPRSPYGASKSSARQYVKVYRESYGLYAVQGWLFNHEGTRRGKQFVTRKISQGVAKIKKQMDLFDVGVEGISPLVLNVVPIELGNLDAKRDWSDAEDMVDAVWRMLNQELYNPILNQEHQEEWYELYNEYENKRQMTKWESKRIKDYVTASGENHTIREFVELAFACVGIGGTWRGSGVNEEFVTPLEHGYGYSGITLVKVNPNLYRPAEVDILRGNADLIKKELGWAPKSSFKDLIRKMVENDLRAV